MDLNNNIHECKDDGERVEPGELLEDCWFFGNLLQRKSRMMRSYSDPCSSSNSNYIQDNLPGKSYDETYESIKKLSVSDEINRPNLIKAPSVPSRLERQDSKATSKGSDLKTTKRSNRKKSSSLLSKNLSRAPSLPTSLEKEEFEDEEEIEFSMGKLIRQASMKCSDTLPPRTHSTKGVSPNCSITKSRRKPEIESIKFDGLDDIISQHPINLLKTQKSLIESEEVMDKKYLSPNVTNNIISGLQEKIKIEEEEEEEEDVKINRRGYCGVRSSSAPPVPKWGGKRSTEDMKAQIKFWARAVASNVRQEC